MTNRTAITGASQGIGRATAIRLASDFTVLVLVSRNEKELQQTAEMISKSGSPAETLVLVADLRGGLHCLENSGEVPRYPRRGQHCRRSAATRSIHYDRQPMG